MRAVVWKIGKWKQSKWQDGDNLVVVFKGIEKEDAGKTYKVNINSLASWKQHWLQLCIEGNTLDGLALQEGKNVFKPFVLPRLVPPLKEGKEAVDEEGNLPAQLELPI